MTFMGGWRLSEAASVFCHIFRASQHEILQFIGYLDDRVRPDEEKTYSSRQRQQQPRLLAAQLPNPELSSIFFIWGYIIMGYIVYRDYYNGCFRDKIGIMEKKMEATIWAVLKPMGTFWVLGLYYGTSDLGVPKRDPNFGNYPNPQLGQEAVLWDKAADLTLMKEVRTTLW